jgi:hypothetical protein
MLKRIGALVVFACIGSFCFESLSFAAPNGRNTKRRGNGNCEIGLMTLAGVYRAHEKNKISEEKLLKLIEDNPMKARRRLLRNVEIYKEFDEWRLGTLFDRHRAGQVSTEDRDHHLRRYLRQFARFYFHGDDRLRRFSQKYPAFHELLEMQTLSFREIYRYWLTIGFYQASPEPTASAKVRLILDSSSFINSNDLQWRRQEREIKELVESFGDSLVIELGPTAAREGGAPRSGFLVNGVIREPSAVYQLGISGRMNEVARLTDAFNKMDIGGENGSADVFMLRDAAWSSQTHYDINPTTRPQDQLHLDLEIIEESRREREALLGTLNGQLRSELYSFTARYYYTSNDEIQKRIFTGFDQTFIEQLLKHRGYIFDRAYLTEINIVEEEPIIIAGKERKLVLVEIISPIQSRFYVLGM